MRQHANKYRDDTNAVSGRATLARTHYWYLASGCSEQDCGITGVIILHYYSMGFASELVWPTISSSSIGSSLSSRVDCNSSICEECEHKHTAKRFAAPNCVARHPRQSVESQGLACCITLQCAEEACAYKCAREKHVRTRGAGQQKGPVPARLS